MYLLFSISKIVFKVNLLSYTITFRENTKYQDLTLKMPPKKKLTWGLHSWSCQQARLDSIVKKFLSVTPSYWSGCQVIGNRKPKIM